MDFDEGPDNTKTSSVYKHYQNNKVEVKCFSDSHQPHSIN